MRRGTPGCGLGVCQARAFAERVVGRGVGRVSCSRRLLWLLGAVLVCVMARRGVSHGVSLESWSDA